MMENCRLCFDISTQSQKASWNRPLFESQNFFVLPSLGALVEGWVLLVPKKHFICVGELPKALHSEMNTLKEALTEALQKSHGSICVFEHGPSKPNLRVGCGVDHAHLHFAPLSFDLEMAVASFLPKESEWSPANIETCQAAFSRGEDYLYLEQPIGQGRIMTNKDFGSQLFRRAIASYLGMPDQYNWREHPQISNVESTVSQSKEWHLNPSKHVKVAA